MKKLIESLEDVGRFCYFQNDAFGRLKVMGTMRRSRFALSNPCPFNLHARKGVFHEATSQ